MRRARIKAVATVPARRKAIKDPSDDKDKQSDSSVPLPSETLAVPVDDEASGKEEIPVHRKEEQTKEAESPIPVAEVSSVDEPPEKPVENEPARLDTIRRSDGPEVADNPVETVKELESPQLEKHEGPENTREREMDRESVKESPERKSAAPVDTVPMAKHPAHTRTSFMRPSPRLDGGGSRIRRNSVQGSGASASESEDDSHRRAIPNIHANHRARNDSVCSAGSPSKNETPANRCSLDNPAGAQANNIPNATPPTASTTKISSIAKPRQKRKINVSESARKLAEARREFLLKYEHKQPDRTKLTMYDLIYYNPVTNPIKKADNAARPNANPPPTQSKEAELEDEDEDCDEAEAMPVPQVKVGPDGHLVLDERSLVIEHTGAKKSRQMLARTEALVDDDSTGYGFYKKRQKTRDWSKWETLKFYKALNTVGTDFLLMQSLFPERTRQEIKMKFKKEEKMNRRFVEKALVYHQEFDIESLQQDLASFEETVKKENVTMQCEKTGGRRSNMPKRSRNKSRRFTASSISETVETEETEETTPTDTLDATECTETTETSGVEMKRASKRRQASPMSGVTSETTCRDSDASESEPEIYNVKPTRSGRYPKIRKLQAPSINTLDNLFSDTEHAAGSEGSSSPEITEDEDEDAGIMSPKRSADSSKSRMTATTCNIGQVVPGSLVIVSRESADEPGETVLQVYMVSSDIEDANGNPSAPSMTPLELTPELLDTVTVGIDQVDPLKFDDN